MALGFQLVPVLAPQGIKLSEAVMQKARCGQRAVHDLVRSYRSLPELRIANLFPYKNPKTVPSSSGSWSNNARATLKPKTRTPSRTYQRYIVLSP